MSLDVNRAPLCSVNEFARTNPKLVTARQEPAPRKRSIQRDPGSEFLPSRRALDDHDLGIAQSADRIHDEELAFDSRSHVSLPSANASQPRLVPVWHSARAVPDGAVVRWSGSLR